MVFLPAMGSCHVPPFSLNVEVFAAEAAFDAQELRHVRPLWKQIYTVSIGQKRATTAPGPSLKNAGSQHFSGRWGAAEIPKTALVGSWLLISETGHHRSKRLAPAGVLTRRLRERIVPTTTNIAEN
jgi:hypothetical protein